MSTSLKSADEYNQRYHDHVVAENLRQQEAIKYQRRQEQIAELERLAELPSQIEKYKVKIVRELENNHGKLPLNCSGPPKGGENEINHWLEASGMKLNHSSRLVGECGWSHSYQIVASKN